MSTRKQYSDEFKIEAVKLSETSGQTLSQVAKSLGVSLATLSEWRTKAMQGKLRGAGGKVLSFSDASELQRLKRDNARLQKENEILKLAAAFFAKESL